MAERTAIIGSRVGLHARPAAIFAEAAAELPVEVTIAALQDSGCKRDLKPPVSNNDRAI
ncbi:hypothetical protein CIK84_12965 [Glutamicibacter arilaitensis]|uniref:Phosphocarrier protein HPr n=2 Tax=Glutamicibacter arilaitensis TaxID=256701 RepID=A0A2N7S0B4_9MICC|nr:hypothetical protein CIK84_12965 [Glutamicibacter arilaitensis]